MTYLPSKRRAHLLVLVAALVPATSVASASDPALRRDAAQTANASDTSATRQLPAWPRSLPFATADDERTFHEIARQASRFPIPNPRRVAKDIIKERWNIDGDAYVVAHFATADQRARETPDNVMSLIDALINAFPDHDRHGWFAELSDTVGGLNGGGAASPGIVATVVHLVHGKNAADVFSTLGKLLWSRTGPGYIYNTFFAKGNVIETVREDRRPLDEAFGIYKVGGFDAGHASPILLSQLVESFAAPGTFSELPYVSRLKAKLDAYWARTRADWPLLARYEFVMQARHARDTGLLTEAQYGAVMQAAASQVPLNGPVTLEQLRKSSPSAGRARRFDINGYAASDLIRFFAPDKSEIMYMPGETPRFVVVRDEAALRQWTLTQAKDPAKATRLLAHFGEWESQDSLFWTGVKHGLEDLATGRWQADGGTVDHAETAISGDVFEAMRTQAEERLSEDAKLQASTAWDAWRTRINRTATLVAPLGYVPILAIPVQIATGLAGVGTGIEQAIDGRTEAERAGGVEQVVSTVVTNVPLGAVFGHEMRTGKDDTASNEARPSFVRPQRVHGKIGYPLGPTRPPSWRAERVNRVFARDDGSTGFWAAADVRRHTRRAVPRYSMHLGDGTFAHNHQIYVPLRVSSTARYAQLVHAGRGYRMALADGSPGPLIERGYDGFWTLADVADNYLPGSVLAHRVANMFTTDPRVLTRAAEVLEQFGVSESGPLVTGIGANADIADPLIRLSVGHGFIETLSARLRDPTARTWTLSELRIVAPILAEQTRRALAVFRGDHSLAFAVLPDGNEVAQEDVPDTALLVERRGDAYVVLGPRLPDSGFRYASLFEAVERQRPQFGVPVQMGDGAQREHAFRTMLADRIDATSNRVQLERMHRSWIGSLPMPHQQIVLLMRISRLRYALAHEPASLTPEEIRQIDEVRDLLPDTLPPGVMDSRLLAAGVLSRIAERQSALLPPALEYLTVQDPAVLARMGSQADDDLGMQGRYYARLRHLDGRTQLVEISPDARAVGYEVLAQGDSTHRSTGRYVVERDGVWRPETSLAEGLAVMDPGEFIATSLALTDVLPADISRDLPNVMNIADAIPQPLLRFFSRSLSGAEIAPDGGVVLTVRHPTSGTALRYATHVDRNGRPIPAAPALIPVTNHLPPLSDVHLNPRVPMAMDLQLSSRRPLDVDTYAELFRTGQPISAFIDMGFADLHVSALMTTRRLRGMLREDAHVAFVGSAEDHVFTLIMPADEGALRMAGPEQALGRRLDDLPAGTIIVDPMYGMVASADRYATLVREVAQRWDASGRQMMRVEPDGHESSESPVAFTERMLAAPVRVNLWNPEHDPISERRYVDYALRRHARGLTVRHPGRDWLATREARRDYMDYFRPTTTTIPFADDAPAGDPSTIGLRDLAEAAIAAGLSPVHGPGT